MILTLLAAAFPAAASAQVPLEPPVAVTGAADSITETAANLNGTVDPNGSLTTYQFEYGTTAGYGLVTPVNTASEGTDPVAVKAAIASLTRNTTYHYRLVATNAEGAISRGADRTFRTNPGPQAPTVTSTTSRDVTSRTAQLLTRVDPNGQPTTVRFEYGRTTSYGAFSDRVDVGTGTTSVPVALELDRLRPNTRYHFRAVATNDTGTTRSLDRSFRTPREPTGISIALNPSRVVWGQDLTVVGRINGTAVGGIRVALERQGFPFQTGFTEVATQDGERQGHVQLQHRLAVRDHALPHRHPHPHADHERHPHGVERGPRGHPLAQGRPPQVAHHRRDLAERARRARVAAEALAARALGGRQASGSQAARREPLALPVHGGQAEAQAAGRALPRRRARARRGQARPRPQPRGPRGTAAQALNPPPPSTGSDPVEGGLKVRGGGGLGRVDRRCRRSDREEVDVVLAGVAPGTA